MKAFHDHITRQTASYILLALIVLALILAAIMSVQYSPAQYAAVAVLPVEIPFENQNATTTPPLIEMPLFHYIEVRESCGPYYEGECVRMRSGPGTHYPTIARLRTGVVLKVALAVRVEDVLWYKIAVDESLHFPERVESDWYVAADVVHPIMDDGDHFLTNEFIIFTEKHITVDVSEQMLYAYDGDTLYMQERISTGLEFSPTPRGTFTVFKMTPSRYMQGPIPNVSEDFFDLPGVPWNMYFTYGGAVIHGAYWHDHFGQPWSHGCVNLTPDAAKQLYLWTDIGTKVTVRD